MLRWLRWSLWSLVVLLVACTVLLTLRARHESAARAATTARALPEFRLLERDGRSVTRRDLLGKVTVVTFIFTRCTDSCPLQTARMAQLQRELADEPDLRLVSVTVDPEHDTPAVLAAYAARVGADPRRWLFLTGQAQDVWRFMGDALSLPAPAGSAAGRGGITHTGGLLLVGRDGVVRGFFGGQDSESWRAMREETLALLHEGPP